MLPINILEKAANSIIYEIPPGKPNPNQKCPVGLDTRDRVIQSATKGATCWDYAFNMIRHRIGKVPGEEHLKERAIEKLCSARRKEITDYDNAFPVSPGELYSDVDNKALKQIDLKQAERFIKETESKHQSEILEDGRPNIRPYMEEFVKEKKHKNLLEFLIYKRCLKLLEINTKFLKNFNTNLSDLFKHEKWHKMGVEEQAVTLDACIRDLCADLYNLNRSSWTPKLGIDKLIEELKNHGPMMVGGHFGTFTYSEPPYEMTTKAGDRSLYAWKPGNVRLESEDAAHSIVLVGAKKVKDKSYVYFVDPNDPSDPKDRTKQKIYIISFANLASNICEVTGLRTPEADQYAYYGNFKL
jgi:hypothetical protein